MTVPETDPDFDWTAEAWGRALRSRSLSRAARHFFTTRQLRLRGTPADEQREWAAVARTAGVEPDRLAFLKQVHGRDVVIIRREEGWRSNAAADPPSADIIASDDPALAVAVQVADCVPLLLADPATGRVAAAHAGWRGMAAGAPGAAVEALRTSFGAGAPGLVAAAGPSIGPCCYEVGPDVREAFERAGYPRDMIARWFSDGASAGPGRTHAPSAGRFMLDLWAATRDQLLSAGLEEENIHLSRLCTACHPSACWSYRRDGAGTGRMAGVIRAGQRLRP
jgi:YfiH family protein